jgi:cystathionine beta-lyase/cystathionine gamma-synthase
MAYSATPKSEREKAGVADNIVRLSVGIENVENRGQAMAKVR